MARFILLDRDGVINRKIQNGYVTSWRQFHFLPGALDALRLFNEAGYCVLVVSNQAGAGKGLMTVGQLNQITRRFLWRVRASGGLIDKVYYCTHRKEAHCACRKPRIGLLLEAREEYNFDFSGTYLVGDSMSDLLAAARAGCPMILVNGNPAGTVKEWPHRPCTVVPSLRAAADYLLCKG